MEFWGIEVKPGQSVKCEPGEERLLHLSQAALGETKGKGAENVPLYVKFNDQKLVLGTLSAENCAHISYDLVFEKEFELSHGAKNASVYFCGYKSDHRELSDDEFSDFDSEEGDEDVAQLASNINGLPKVKGQGGKPATVKASAEKEDKADGKAKAKTGAPAKAALKVDEEDDDDDDDDDDEEEEDDSEGSDDEDMVEAALDDSDDDDDDDDDDSDDDEEDESDDEEDEATPKKSAKGKKRSAESDSKTPVPEKKAKLVTPAGKKSDSDGKNSGHVATPHPAKGGKTPATNDKAKQSPKAAGSIKCKACPKTFTSENALQAHSKAKHT